MNFKQFTSSPHSHFARQFFCLLSSTSSHVNSSANFQKHRTNFQQHFLLICIFYVRHDDDLIYVLTATFWALGWHSFHGSLLFLAFFLGSRVFFSPTPVGEWDIWACSNPQMLNSP